jgi:hypothetical protein
MHVALGWPYRGRRVVQGTIVYCLFEGQRNFAARKEAFRLRHLVDYGEDIPFFLVPIKLQLVQDHAKLIDSIRIQIGNMAPRVVVLDTLNRSFTGDENATQSMTEYVGACDAIREAFDCLTIVVHHSGLEGSRSRGSSVLLGAADAQIRVKKNADGEVESAVEYMKDGADGLKLLSRLEVMDVGNDEYGDAITSCVLLPVEETKPSAPREPRLTANEKTMLLILREAGPSGLTTDQWNARARDAGVGSNRRQNLYGNRKSLQEKGLICGGACGWFAKH